MGIRPLTGIGQQSSKDKAYTDKLENKWGVKNLPTEASCQCDKMKQGQHKNIFIFGEDPIGCAIDKKNVEPWFKNTEFMLVQDLFMTETAERADLVLPASLHIETDGSFTNTQKVIQEFSKQVDSKVEKLSHEQLIDLLAKFGVNGSKTISEVRQEIFSLLPSNVDNKMNFNYTECECNKRYFEHGCDIIEKKIKN